MTHSKQNRRNFLKTTGAGATALSAGVFSGGELSASTSANEKLNIACIGTANRAAAALVPQRADEASVQVLQGQPVQFLRQASAGLCLPTCQDLPSSHALLRKCT